MLIQPVNNTNFGKIGKTGGKVLGRGQKATKLMAGSDKAAKLSAHYKSHIKQTYNSLANDKGLLAEELNKLCNGFMEKVDILQNKFVPKK